MNKYLNEENLKHLDRISGCVKLNYSKFIKRMIRDQEEETDDCSNGLPKSRLSSKINSQKSSAAKSQVGQQGSRFKVEEASPAKAAVLPLISERTRVVDLTEKRTQHLDIGTMQSRSDHLVRNKLSDKFGRRDVCFYDMYVKKEDAQELGLLNDRGFPLDIDAEQYYREIEVEDFNHIFYQPNIIEEKFGKSIKVSLILDSKTSTLRRRVIENPDLIAMPNPDKHSSP